MAKTPTTKRKPKAVTFPEMGALRIKELDDICDDIADAREKQNDGKAAELKATPTAMKALKKHLKTTWSHGGVVIALNEKSESLSVKVLKPKKRKADQND